MELTQPFQVHQQSGSVALYETDDQSPLCEPEPLTAMYDGRVALIVLNSVCASVSPATMLAVSQMVGNDALALVTGSYE